MNYFAKSIALIQTTVTKLLKQNNKTSEVFVEIKLLFDTINSSHLWIKPFSVALGFMKNHLFLFEHYYPNNLDKQGIVISQANEKKCLFYHEGEWVLDDDFFEINEIAKVLSHWKVFESPKSVYGIKKLIDAGLWAFDTEELPKISGSTPKDITEIVSWDDKRVLHGTTKENAVIMSREEWNSLVEREKRLYD